MSYYLIGGAIIGVIALILIVSMLFRVVVHTNEVHIVQSKKSTQPYGKDLEKGAVYFNWPSWLPIIGITRITLPMSIFTVDLSSYYAYDQGKVPFEVDVMAWFRVSDAATAAQRIEDFTELKGQLDDILRGAVRKVLAGYDVEKIMETRKEMSGEFVKEVLMQAKAYGVETISVEFMDIRDPASGTSKTINDIMNKKKSLIDRESRIAVAENTKMAEIAEIEARREADVMEQQAQEKVGEREAQKIQRVGVARQLADQEIQMQAKVTEQNKMAVLEVERVRSAEIEKQTQIVKSQEVQQKMIIEAEGFRKQTEEVAEGKKNAEIMRAEGVKSIGIAEGKALEAIQLAPVTAQITLGKEIGANKGYQNYLLGLEQVKASIEIGIAKAKALEAGDMKVVVSSGSVDGGVDNLMDLLGPKGGASIASMLEVLKQYPAGKEIYDKLLNKEEEVINIGVPTEVEAPEQPLPDQLI